MTANTTYSIEVIHKDRHAWAAELSQAVAAELIQVGLHRTVEVIVSESSPQNESPTIATYLGSTDSAADTSIRERISKTIDSGTVIVPVVEDLGAFSTNVPPALILANGFEWSGPESAEGLARLLLEDLGIEDQQRRVFISHKREDGLGAAEQLHDRLAHSGFSPFIDRFAIRAGVAVQAAIADALEDHAFLLLLETPLAHTSDWVFDEVDYALSHTMGTLILQWPGNPPPVPGSIEVPRLRLSSADLATDSHDYDILTEAALDTVVGAVEAAHAQGLVRRRQMLVRSIAEAALASGCSSCLPLPNWRLRVEHERGSTLVGVTPRLPTAKDLQHLDQERAMADADPLALLVHSARVLRSARREHLDWVVGDRELALIPENAIGGWW